MASKWWHAPAVMSKTAKAEESKVSLSVESTCIDMHEERDAEDDKHNE
jgi:hypothetical protein